MVLLTAVAILYINRGPECFHRAVVNYLFNINDINCCYNKNGFDGELYSKLKELKDGNKRLKWCKYASIK